MFALDHLARRTLSSAALADRAARMTTERLCFRIDAPESYTTGARRDANNGARRKSCRVAGFGFIDVFLRLVDDLLFKLNSSHHQKPL